MENTDFYRGKNGEKERVRLIYDNPNTNFSKKTNKDFRIYKLSTPQGDRSLFTEDDSWGELDKIARGESFDLTTKIRKIDGKGHTRYTVEKLDNHESAEPAKTAAPATPQTNGNPAPAANRPPAFSNGNGKPEVDPKVWAEKDLRLARESAIKSTSNIVGALVATGHYTEVAIDRQITEVANDVLNMSNQFMQFIYKGMKKPTDGQDDDLPF